MALSCFRGDTLKLEITASLNNEPYSFRVGDTVKVGIKAKKSKPKCALYKEVKVTEEKDTIVVVFSHDEMKKTCEGDKILEAELTDVSGNVYTLFQEKLKIEGDIINE